MFKKLRIKLFGRSKKEIYKDMNFLIAEISDYLDDIEYDLDELHESVKESNNLVLLIQEQCQQIIEKMEKKEERTLEEIVDNIEKLVSKMPKREEADIKKISRQIQNYINHKTGHYVEIKDDLGLVCETFYIEDEDNENV